MPLYEIDKISYDQIRKLDRKKTFVLASQSPIEVHGPHLPLGQDLYSAQAIAGEVAERFLDAHPDWNVLVLHPIPVAADGVPRLGSISFPPKVVRDVAYYTMLPFAKMGFARLGFSSFHGGPRHFLALEEACERLNAAAPDSAAICLFSAAIARLEEGQAIYDACESDPEFSLTLPQIKEDHHAAFMETSLALYGWPELVEEGWEDLPTSISTEVQEDADTNDSYLYGYEGKASLTDRVKRGMAVVKAVHRALRHFQDSTYHGRPAAATKERGEMIFEKLSCVCLEIVEEFVEKGRAMDPHSPLWKIRHIALSNTLNVALDKWINPLADEPQD